MVSVTPYYSLKQDVIIFSADKLYQATGFTLDKEYESPKKSNIILLEAHLCLDHLLASGIIKSIEMTDFDDVKMVNEERNAKNIWCGRCASGKLCGHFHYMDSIFHYTSQKESGVLWSLHIFILIVHIKERYLLVMMDSVLGFVIATIHIKTYKNKIGEQIGYNIYWIEKQYDVKMKEFIVEIWKKLDNEIIEQLIHRNCINTIYTSIEDHQSNGKTKRSVRTIIEDTRALLQQLRLPFRFYTYAILASVNVRNCIFNKKIGESSLWKISNHTLKIKLRSLIPLDTPPVIWNHRSKKKSIRKKSYNTFQGSKRFWILLLYTNIKKNDLYYWLFVIWLHSHSGIGWEERVWYY